MVAQTQNLFVMKINDRPYLFKYVNRDGDTIVFTIDVQETVNRAIPTYNQFINGLCIGDLYSITEIHRLMENGYEWTTL